MFFTVNLHFGAGIFAHEDPVAFFQFKSDAFTLVINATGTYCNYDAFLRFFIGCIRNDNPAANRFAGFLTFNKDKDC